MTMRAERVRSCRTTSKEDTPPIVTAPNPIACGRLSAPASGGYIMSDMSAKVEMGISTRRRESAMSRLR